jgi:hypothetical protein
LDFFWGRNEEGSGNDGGNGIVSEKESGLSFKFPVRKEIIWSFSSSGFFISEIGFNEDNGELDDCNWEGNENDGITGCGPDEGVEIIGEFTEEIFEFFFCFALLSCDACRYKGLAWKGNGKYWFCST